MITKRVVVLAVTLVLLAVTANAQWLTNGSHVYYNGGNVGIGTSTPNARLHIFGSITSVSAVNVVPTLSGNAGATNIGLQIAPTASVASGTFAGINAQVDQFGAASGTTGEMMGLAATARHWDPITVSFAYGAKYAVHNRGGGAITNAYGSYVSNALNNGGGTIGTQYGLYLENITGATTNYAIYSAGGQNYLGGLLTLGSNLTVAGDATINGNIAAKYQDVAEWVPTTEKLSYGTVVIIDPELTNQVVASTSPYDTRVAGVISEKPGLLLGEAGPDKVLVATTGRVKVKVDASKGEIKIGDLLVTGEKSGVAMKSQPIDIGGAKIHRPGTVVGKALEPLKEGQGEILVLLSLQ